MDPGSNVPDSHSSSSQPGASDTSSEPAHFGAIQTILSLGEERLGEVVNQLLSNERFVSAVQSAISGSLNAKRTVDKSITRFFGLINVPTLENVDQVRQKMAEVEEALTEIHERVKLIDEKITKRGADGSKSDAPKSDAAGSPKKKAKKKPHEE